jgi:D-alanine-D-alanine ligase
MITVLHDAVEDDAPPDARDALVQAETVRGALEALGHEVAVVPCTLDLAALAHELERQRPDLVFNLVESLGGHGRLIAHVLGLLDALRVPYTGASAEAMYLTSNKLLAKEWLRAAGLPTPPTVAVFPDSQPTIGRAPGAAAPVYLVKSVWEHASIGLDEERALRAVPDAAHLQARARDLGGACFAEPYIDGRELNLSLLGTGDGDAQVLPPAEISFAAFPAGRLRIVGYRAKWDEGSFEYDNTPRQFEFAADDAALLAEVEGLARRAWRAFGLRGHARVDFRVDTAGRPFILEVNANPCLSPDAGFAAAAARGGLDVASVVGHILRDARPS